MSVNISGFQDLCDGDTDKLRELIELYSTKTKEQVLELEKAIITHAPSEVARMAHSMVGANLMVGMDSVVPLLRKLEQYGEEGDLAKATAAFEELTNEFRAIQTDLEGVGNGLQKLRR